MKKKLFAVLLTAALCTASLTGCGTADGSAQNSSEAADSGSKAKITNAEALITAIDICRL